MGREDGESPRFEVASVPAAEIELDAERVRAIVEGEAPEFAKGTPVRVGSGWDCEIRRLDGPFAARLPRRAAAAGLVSNEQRWLPLLAPRLPVPVPVPVVAGRPSAVFPWPWSLVRWIEGETADSAQLGAEAGGCLAAFLRRLHAPAPAEAPCNPYRGVPLASRAASVSACLGRLKASAGVISPAIERAWEEALEAPTCRERVWLHGDLHGHNVLVREGFLAGVIDWGDLCAGDPATDLMMLWTVLDDPVARAEAIRTYAPDPPTLARARGWAILWGAVAYEAFRDCDRRRAALAAGILGRVERELS